MSKPFYVKFVVPKELADKAYQLVQISRESGRIKKGTNEVTKAIERGIAKLTLIAEDVDPPQIVAHIPLLCEERKVPYLFVPSKLELGRSAGIDVGCSSISIVEEGEASETLKELVKDGKKLVKSGDTKS